MKNSYYGEPTVSISSNLTIKMGSMFSGFKGEETLEEFNVRVLFDKLEDQNLHLASQLARHQDDVRNFYNRICKQNEELKDMLNNLDMDKLEKIEKERAKQQEKLAKDRARGQGQGMAAGGDNINVVGTSLTLGGAAAARKYKFAGTDNLYLPKKKIEEFFFLFKASHG